MTLWCFKLSNQHSDENCEESCERTLFARVQFRCICRLPYNIWATVLNLSVPFWVAGYELPAPSHSTKYITFDCRLDPQDKNSEKVARKLKVFKNGTPEEYCKWRIDYDDLVTYPSFKKKAETKFGLLLSII
jgi:hypothetical protein